MSQTKIPTAKPEATAITPTREQDFPEWYQQVIAAADLAEVSEVRGCMVIKPWGYRIWELLREQLDALLRATGQETAHFPAFYAAGVHRQGSGAHRGLREGMRGRDAHAVGSRAQGQAGSRG